MNDKQIVPNEFDTYNSQEGAVRDARMGFQRDQMHLISRRNWPKGATRDEKLYALVSSQAMSLVVDGDDQPVYDENGEMQFAVVDSQYTNQPTFDPTPTGTYVEMSEKANMLMSKQREMNGVVAWIFTPELVEGIAA